MNYRIKCSIMVEIYIFLRYFICEIYAFNVDNERVITKMVNDEKVPDPSKK